MATCPICSADVPPGAQYCPQCGAAQPISRGAAPAPSWGSPPRVNPDGTLAQPSVGPPLSTRQVWVGVGAVLTFLLLLALYAGRSWSSEPTATADQLPVLGAKGEAVPVGDTVVGVAFTDTTDALDGKPAQRGEFYAVGIVVGNHGSAPFELTVTSLSLALGAPDATMGPTFVAWGEPEDLNNGRYKSTYRLAPGATIAGMLVFDVARTHAGERLLVRDLTVANSKFAGAIDLTRDAE